MVLLWIAVLLPSLILATDTNWQYQIYVSSSDGINSSSCWNGSVPCNTLNLALQGVRHTCNSTVIYLYPGIYTLDDEVRNISRVAIIGLSNDVAISCHHQPVTGQWLDNVIVYCIIFNNCPTTISNSIPCPYKICDYCESDKLHVNVLGSLAYPGDKITFTAFLYDSCSDRMYIESNLTVCIVSGPESVKLCSTDSNCINTSINSLNQYSFSICYFGKEMTYNSTIDINVKISTEADVSTNTTIKVRPYCYYVYDNTSGKCYSPPYSYFTLCSYLPIYMYTNTCAPNTTVSICGSCEDGYSVPINLPNKCVQCDDPLIDRGWILFVTVQLLPVTVMVLLIIVLNIQLTSRINALVFYSQILTIVYPGLTLNAIFGNPLCYYDDARILHFSKLYLIPFNILNLDFTLFLGDYPLCISSATTPFGAVLFRYVIGLYPLVLLLLLYVWITLYNKGYKVIVLITRPIHRLLARFWRMTNIEPSLPHSIASIYLLCFMQLAATSFTVIHFAIGNNYNSIWSRCLAGIFAILVLILLVLIPMLYIQLYPFKPFHKLLECLHLNKLQILTSLGDVFTGPYKNGTTNKLDYRYFAGFYLLLRIIILLLHFIPIFVIIPSLQASIFFVFCGVIIIFRPYQRNVNNFNVFLIFLFLLTVSTMSAALTVFNQGTAIIMYSMVTSFDALFFLIWLGYFIYWIVKKTRSCYGYYRAYRSQGLNNTPIDNANEYKLQDIIDDNDWIADRMINPQDYDEKHSSITPYELYKTSSNDETNN